MPPTRPTLRRRAGGPMRAAASLCCAAALALAPSASPRAATRGEEELRIEGDPLIRVLPPDAIPAIDEPVLVSAAAADVFLPAEAPVLGVVDRGHARAYPTWSLDAHEIVNDRLGDLPIAATW